MKRRVDPDGFLMESWPDLPDPPYVQGDHVATCVGPHGWGCEECNPSEYDELVDDDEPATR